MNRPTPFSQSRRASMLASLSREQFDVLIIGGGITGAGIALDAASRGLKVALVEKGDFASGTSSKSTKLIHGGLRYLKQFDFWLVREVGSERAIVHQLAPHLVLPEKMLLPLLEDGNYGKWLTSIGLKIYDLLAHVDEGDQRQMLDKKRALEKEPLLPEGILKGAGYYAEYRTDDARLTLENIKTALNYGALALNYIEVGEFDYAEGKVCGVQATDLITKETVHIKATYVINAAGPWVDELRQSDKSKTERHLYLTKGVHLVFPFEKLPVRQSIYFDVPDGRMIFAIPRGKTTYVGTTDTHYTGDKDHVGVDLADALYLISAVNHMFPDIELELSDVVSSWAGLRPLIFEEGKSASEISRKDELFVSKSGLISIAGGKLTGYRKMAERVLDKVAQKMKEELQRELPPGYTKEIPLCGNGFKDADQVEEYVAAVYIMLQKEGLSLYDARYLVTTYGQQTDLILENFAKITKKDPYKRLVLAELMFCMDFEMVYTPLDFFARRTGRLFFDLESIPKLQKAVIKAMAKKLQWSEAQRSAHTAALEAQIRTHGLYHLKAPN